MKHRNSGASVIEVIFETGLILFIVLLALPVAAEFNQKGSSVGMVGVALLGGIAIFRVAVFAVDVYLARRTDLRYLQHKKRNP